MMTMRITSDDTGDQDAVAAPMQQHPRYGRALALCGAEVRRLAIAGDDGAVFGRAQVVTRRLGPLVLSMIGRGPVWHGPGVAGRQRAALRQIARGTGPLVAIPGAQVAPMPRGPGLIALMTPAHHAVLDLGPGPAGLRAGLGGKWRNRLVRAEADAVAVSRARDFGWLLAAEAGLFLTHKPWASYHIGWSGEEGRRRNAHGLILWRAITDLAAEGLAALDLGTVDTEAAPGLARFKIGTGARVAPLGPTLLVLPALTRRRC